MRDDIAAFDIDNLTLLFNLIVDLDALREWNESEEEDIEVDDDIDSDDQPEVVDVFKLNLKMALFVSVNFLLKLDHLIYLFCNILGHYYKKNDLKDLGDRIHDPELGGTEDFFKLELLIPCILHVHRNIINVLEFENINLNHHNQESIKEHIRKKDDPQPPEP